MICANPECAAEFALHPQHPLQRYCCPRCTARHYYLTRYKGRTKLTEGVCEMPRWLLPRPSVTVQGRLVALAGE